MKEKIKEATIIDIAIKIAAPGDTRIADCEQNKILAYQDLKREIKRVWQLRKVDVILIAIGALETVPSSQHCELQA